MGGTPIAKKLQSAHKEVRMSLRRSLVYFMSVAIVCSFAFVSIGIALAEDTPSSEDKQATMKKPLRVDDLPKPVSKALKKMKEVGDDVGEAISRGASKAAGATKKALKGDGKEKE
jgi:hypothetical protein